MQVDLPHGLELVKVHRIWSCRPMLTQVLLVVGFACAPYLVRHALRAGRRAPAAAEGRERAGSTPR